MEAIPTEQTRPETSSGIGRKSNIVEPFLRLQNKATSWTSKSESDLTRLGFSEETPQCCGSSFLSNTRTDVACDLSEMQNPASRDFENSCISRKQRRDVLERISILSDSTPHCCTHGASKYRRRNSSSALLDGFTVSKDYFNEQEYAVMKARPRLENSNPQDVCNEYAVPFPIVKTKSNPVVEYGNIVTGEDRTRMKNSSCGNLSSDDNKEISVSDESSNICHCIGKQKFVEGHYKVAYLCDIKNTGRNESASSSEKTSQKVEYEGSKHTNVSSSTKNALTQQITDEETNTRYDCLPVRTDRTSVTSFQDSGSHIYSNFMGTNCLVHKCKVPNSNTEEGNHYGNCICSNVEVAVPVVDDEHQRRHHSGMPSRASSTTSNVIRSTTKRKLDDSPVKLSELCMRVLMRTVSTHSTLHSDKPLYCY